MESRWANQILQEMQPKKNKVESSNKQGKKAVIIVLPIMFVIFLVAMLASGKQMDQNMVTGILIMAGCFIFIFLIVLVATRKSKNVDISKDFVDSVNHVISIDGAQMLDEEMGKQPNASFHGYMDQYFYATDHYIVFKYKKNGIFKRFYV